MARDSTRKRKRQFSTREQRSSKTGVGTFSFPYFAHDQLDPEVFPDAIGRPVERSGRAPVPQAPTKPSSDFLKDYNRDLEFEEDAREVSVDFEHANPHAFDKNPYKRLKTVGGRPALAKKVTADLDSDDEMIVRMRNAKYLEREIAQRLVDEGRIKYNHKTIGTRLARINKKLRERTDELLDQQLVYWHEGDDDALRSAIQKTNVELERLHRELEAKRWKMVADNLKSIKSVTNFSQNACKIRFQKLKDDTAEPTPESITNPDEKILEIIQARIDGEQKIERDRVIFRAKLGGDDARVALAAANLKGNAWNSKQKLYD